MGVTHQNCWNFDNDKNDNEIVILVYNEIVGW